jgi:MFS family permease
MFGWRKPQINKIVLTLIYSDFLFLSAGGFLTPIYAVYVTQQIHGGTVAVVGFATTIFWIVKSTVQFPVSWYADKVRGERDDFTMLVVGSVIASAVPLLYYLFAERIWHVYALEALNGVGFALAVPTWLAIFTRHIDSHRESTEWTLHSNAIGFGFAAASAVGGLMAERYGFRVIFLLVSAFMFLGTVAILWVKEELMDGSHGPSNKLELEARLQKEMTKH